MPKATDASNTFTGLRDKAEAELQAGTASTANHWSLGVDALSLLHRLSSNPDNAQDALKLLHELQVHQVELDLQNEAIADNEQALSEDLRLYRELYVSAPFAYFLVDLEGGVIQGNLAAADLLGLAPDDLAGHSIDSFLLPESRPLLRGLLDRVAQGGIRESCEAETRGDAKGSRYVRFLASTPPGREHVLLACCERDGADPTP